LLRLLDGRHQIDQFFNPEHSNVPDRRGEPGETPGQIDRGKDTGHGVNLLATEVDTPLLPRAASEASVLARVDWR
jgi:hypothetical protein